MRKILSTAAMLLSITVFAEVPAYKNPEIPVERRVEDLLQRMTLQEKILQISQGFTGSNDNPNNVMENFKKFPPEIGSLIYYSRTMNFSRPTFIWSPDTSICKPLYPDRGPETEMGTQRFCGFRLGCGGAAGPSGICP